MVSASVSVSVRVSASVSVGVRVGGLSQNMQSIARPMTNRVNAGSSAPNPGVFGVRAPGLGLGALEG